MMGMEGTDRRPGRMNAVVDWSSVIKVFDKTPKEQLMRKVTETVLQTNSTIAANILNRYIDATSREAYIKTTMIELMSTPEYQLC